MTTAAQVREFPMEWSDTIEREESLAGGDVIIMHKSRRDVRIVRSEAQWEPKVMTRETPISSTEYRRRRWGPFAWYEKV